MTRVKAYNPRPPQQLSLPGIPAPRGHYPRGLALARERAMFLDDTMCDVATRRTRGRLHGSVEEDELRTAFERDWQRAASSELFLRERNKTQVFPLAIDPAVRNRLSHSFEVANLSECLAAYLRLNPDLARAIGLAHDVGHSPFGHAGEKVLDAIRQRELGLFHKHNIFSLTLIDEIFRKADTGEYLDLTFETRDGIICHLGETSEQEIIPWGALPAEPPKDLSLAGLKKGDVERLEDHRVFYPSTLEGAVVRFADRISSVARDPEDAVKHNIIQWQDLPDLSRKVFAGKDGQVNASTIIKTLVQSLVENSWNETHQTIYSIKLGDIESQALNELYAFNFDRIYRHARVTDEFLSFAPFVVHTLFLNLTLEQQGETLSAQEAINRIAYMTDREAMSEIEKIKRSKFELRPIV